MQYLFVVILCFDSFTCKNATLNAYIRNKMDKRPLFLGKGRGRGRGNEEKGTKPAASAAGGHSLPAKWGNPRKAENGGANSPKVPEASKERQEKANEIKESAKRYLEKMDDEFEDSSEDEEINDGEILNNTLKNYRNTSQGIIN